MISIVTVTIGRDLYLKRLIESIQQLGGSQEIEHHIVFNAYQPSKLIEDVLLSYPHIRYDLTERINIGGTLNLLKNKVNGNLFVKLDDDCILRSPLFFDHVVAIHKLEPLAVFSPFPVGLIGNLGGVRSDDRRVIYSEDTDTYYTLRKVSHIGGFARIAPTIYHKQMTFPIGAHDEDDRFSKTFAHRIPFYYLENAIIVEHQESTLGQHERYGNDYFKGRF
jgi:hypothetical protein